MFSYVFYIIMGTHIIQNEISSNNIKKKYAPNFEYQYFFACTFSDCTTRKSPDCCCILLFGFIGFALSILSPIILPFMCIFFILAYIVYVNQVSAPLVTFPSFALEILIVLGLIKCL